MKKENMVQTNQGDTGSENWIAVDNIRISQKYNKIYVANLEVFFPDLEYRLLLLMIQHCNETLSVKYLFENIWGSPFVYSSIAEVRECMCRLSYKVDRNNTGSPHIKTVKEQGYRFV